MSLLIAAFIGLCLYAMIRVLNLASPSLPPSIYSKTRNSDFIQAILSSCPILREPYVPPLLWGKSGHIQTVVYAKLGRMRDPIPSGSRHTKTLSDGSTLTFDLYQPTINHTTRGDYCMLVCPGFGSSSESSYIRALVTHAQACGYRVAVLNHLGCVFSLRLTAPRIFSYGGWEEFHIMRKEVERLYPHSKLLVVGLSMGANIILKYLGEQPSHQQGIWCAISICQGYNVNAAKPLMKQWQNMRRAYLYTMTANQRRLIKHHSDILFTEEMCHRFGLDLKKIFSATTLEDLDLQFTCKLHGCDDVSDFYETSSCSNYMNNINIPLILLNSEDDPIVPMPLFKYAKDYTENHELSAFITTRHGGHLGYFESGFIRPQTISWIDRFVCQVADSVITFMLQKKSMSAGPGSLCVPLKEHQPANPDAEPEETSEIAICEADLDGTTSSLLSLQDVGGSSQLSAFSSEGDAAGSQSFCQSASLESWAWPQAGTESLLPQLDEESSVGVEPDEEQNDGEDLSPGVVLASASKTYASMKPVISITETAGACKERDGGDTSPAEVLRSASETVANAKPPAWAGATRDASSCEAMRHCDRLEQELCLSQESTSLDDHDHLSEVSGLTNGLEVKGSKSVDLNGTVPVLAENEDSLSDEVKEEMLTSIPSVIASAVDSHKL